ncbi:hypothetical protein SYNPS1DRAFT_29563 [Syncephalis pseudoplumigaleata]|uniref:ATP-dependent RNA helicase DHX29-like UBA domain-containing protein n=1 Tax=Syncephalis pseudoplumigaleata TaxID=1712513 RepID=A0A4V1J1D5_9FUNG|nr:hypothetical protein SYNPS1DRAFT_29563 [Syncephalis pseudoplumigaleata]|eukprot:RKP24679.1 hypothetical protein SYNPS1DRAFT_29563 [Syncephalis pseudoplumigaleata]
MAKKKKAPARIQRGYATTSLPKKQAVPDDAEPQNPTASDDGTRTPEASTAAVVEQADTIDPPSESAIITADQVARERELAEKASSTWIYVHEKAATLEQVNQLPRLQLPQQLEKKTAQLWMELGADHYYDREGSLNDPASLVRSLMKTYATLTKIGFDPCSVEQAMHATGGADMTDALDWLCIYAPLEKVPARLRDKFYHLDDDYMVLCGNAADEEGSAMAQKPRVFSETLDVSTIQTQLASAAITDHAEQLPVSADMKQWVLQQYNEETSDEAKLRRLKQEQDLLQSDPCVDAEIVRQLVQQQEQDTRQQAIEEKQREAEARRQQQKQQQSEDWLDHTMGDDEEGDEDEDAGGLLGSLWDASEETEETSAQQSTATVHRVVDEIAYPAGWTGRMPRDVLIEYCRKQDKHSRVTFSPLSGGSGAYHQTEVCIGWSTMPKQAISDTTVCFRRKTDAENYAAVGDVMHVLLAAVHG